MDEEEDDADSNTTPNHGNHEIDEAENHPLDIMNEKEINSSPVAIEVADATKQEKTTPKEPSQGNTLYVPQCGKGSCLDDDDSHKLQCSQCDRLFHYTCTRLPLYQINLFLTKGYRRYLCANCTEVLPHINDFMASMQELPTASVSITNAVDINSNDKSDIKTEITTSSIACQVGPSRQSYELLNTMHKEADEKLRLKDTELQRIRNEKQRIKNENVQMKQSISTLEDQSEVLRKTICAKDKLLANQSNVTDINELTSKLQLSIESDNTNKEIIMNLTERQTEIANELRVSNDECRKARSELELLQTEIAKYETSMKSYENTEVNLKKIIVEKDKELGNQQELLFQVGNPNYDSISKFEQNFQMKFDQLGRSLEETLIREVRQNNNRIDEKLQQVLQNKTYADQAKEATQNETNLPKTNIDLRVIMNEAKNEERVEERDKAQRLPNIILHGVKESETENNEEAKLSDRNYVQKLFDALGVQTTYKIVVRLGKCDPGKKRPIKLVMNSEEEKNEIMINLRKLKDVDSFRGLSVTHDYTLAERQQIKEFSQQAKEKNENEPLDSKYCWRVRGNPKNWLTLKRLPKSRPAV